MSCLQVATLAIPLYSVLPAVGEYMIEEVRPFPTVSWAVDKVCKPRAAAPKMLHAAGLDEGIFEDQRRGRRRILGILRPVHGARRVRHILDASASA